MENAAVKKSRNFNSISVPSNIIINIIFILILILFIAPLVLVVMVSVTANKALLANGYSFLPKALSLSAYEYIFKYSSDVAHAYGMSLIVTSIGSVVATTVIALYAYPLSRSDFGPRNKFAFFAFFTTIFGGGLVPWVFVYTQFLKINSTFWVLIVPYLMNAWWVIIMRTFMKSSVPDELIEAARIDGAGEFKIFARVVIPLSKAGLATIFLFCLLRYWNDYYLSLIFITDHHLYTIQYYMYQMMDEIDYMLNSTSLPPEARRDLPSESARMALSVIAVGPVVFAYPFFQRFFVKGLIIGAVKG